MIFFIKIVFFIASFCSLFVYTSQNRINQEALFSAAFNHDKNKIERMLVDVISLNDIRYKESSIMIECKKAFLNDVGCDGATPLMYAVQRVGYDFIAYLVQNGALWAVKDKAGRTPVHYAVGTKNAQWIDFICKQCPLEYADLADNYGKTPLMKALSLGDIDTCLLLANEYDASIEACDKKGVSCAMYAAQGHILHNIPELCCQAYKEVELYGARRWKDALAETFHTFTSLDELDVLKKLSSWKVADCEQEERKKFIYTFEQYVVDGDIKAAARYLLLDRKFGHYVTNNFLVNSSMFDSKNYKTILGWILATGNTRIQAKNVSEDILLIQNIASGVRIKFKEDCPQTDQALSQLLGILLSFGNPDYSILCHYYACVKDKKTILHDIFSDESTLWTTPQIYKQFFLQAVALSQWNLVHKQAYRLCDVSVNFSKE